MSEDRVWNTLRTHDAFCRALSAMALMWGTMTDHLILKSQDLEVGKLARVICHQKQNNGKVHLQRGALKVHFAY